MPAKKIAILCSDIHLSHKPPIARSAEPDWYEAMRRPLDEIRKMRAAFKIPVICAGDIFDKWNSPPELINFAMHHLPYMHTIPGQHDLPLHQIGDIYKSAYQTLAMAGAIYNMIPGSANNLIPGNGLIVHPFPWGFPITDIEEYKKQYPTNKDCFHLACVHEYCWTRGASYPGADKAENATSHWRKLKGYDAGVFGDNHKGFISTNPKTGKYLINCGGLMRRNIDQIDYKPQVGILYSDGTIKPHYLDCSKDVFIEQEEYEIITQALDVSNLVNELFGVHETDFDFRAAVRNFVKKNTFSKKVEHTILEIVDNEYA